MTEEHRTFVPESVRRQARLADEAIQALRDQQQQKTPETHDQQTTDTEAATSAPSQQGADTTGQAPAAPEVAWEAKYNTLRGKYDAEVPRLRSQITSLVSENERLKADLQVARTAKQSDTAPQPPGAAGDTDGRPVASTQPERFDPNAFEDYGDDIVNLVNGFNRLQEENAQLRGQVSQVNSSIEESRVNAFYSKLSELAPNWRELDQDQKFLEHIGQVNSVTGKPLIMSIREAQANLDAPRVAAIFNEYQPNLKKPKQPPGQQATPVVTPPPPPISPPKGATATELPAQPRTYTRADIKKFFDDKVKGLYRGREADAAKLEQDMVLATKQGRVVG